MSALNPKKRSDLHSEDSLSGEDYDELDGLGEEALRKARLDECRRNALEHENAIVAVTRALGCDVMDLAFRHGDSLKKVHESDPMGFCTNHDAQHGVALYGNLAQLGVRVFGAAEKMDNLAPVYDPNDPLRLLHPKKFTGHY